MKLFVWDLHGVLEQGNDRAAVDISNEVLRRFGHVEQFTYDDGVSLYGRKWFEYFEWLLKGVDRDYCTTLQDACFELSERDIEFQRRWLTPTTHAWDVLSTISQKQHHQILISNTRSANLEMFVKMLGLEPFFALEETALAVDGHGPDVGRTKQDTLRDYLSRPDLSYSDIVIIGDSPNDMRLADVAGGVTYLYTHPDFPFRKCDSDYKICDLRDVLTQL